MQFTDWMARAYASTTESEIDLPVASSSDEFAAMMADLKSNDLTADFISIYRNEDHAGRMAMLERISGLRAHVPDLWLDIQYRLSSLSNLISVDGLDAPLALCMLTVMLDVSPSQQDDNFCIPEKVQLDISKALPSHGVRAPYVHQEMLTLSTAQRSVKEQISWLQSVSCDEAMRIPKLAKTTAHYKTSKTGMAGAIRLIPCFIAVEPEYWVDGPDDCHFKTMQEKIAGVMLPDFSNIRLLALSLYGQALTDAHYALN